MSKRALILGIGGQDGSYLAEHLLSLGYEVHGLVRRSSVDNLWRIRPILDQVTLHRADLCDAASIGYAISCSHPDEIYHEADQDNIDWSYEIPGYSVQVTAGSIITILGWLKRNKPKVRVFIPLSATMFGDAPPPQNEQTPFKPMSPYACAKVAAYYLCQHYRREHGIFVSTAIMYNHDSPRRGGDYLLQKICRQAVEIKQGKREKILVGSPHQIVDIGHARDFMIGAQSILQLDKPDDFVLGSGQNCRVIDYATTALTEAMVPSPYQIDVDPDFKRPGTIPTLVADDRKAIAAFGWGPKTKTHHLIREIVEKYQQCP